MSRDIGDLKTQVAVLKNSIENLEKLGPIGRLKAQATKLGIQDPQINLVDLKPQATFTATFTQRDQPNSFVRLDFDIEEISKDAITLVIRGNIVDRGKPFDQFGPIRHKIPLTNKTFTFHLTGRTSTGKEIPFPAVRLAFLARDEINNNLTIATGLTSTPST